MLTRSVFRYDGRATPVQVIVDARRDHINVRPGVSGDRRAHLAGWA